ncbi:MAG: VacB/RNase II family 3'-5' exoribonuclease [Dysgonamonadaceae bacterium]|nr:VacB/RNase II family 3'-5' exoribonuclease [Dysgonamonadaceae bacterium]
MARNIGVNDIDGQCIMDEALRYLLVKGKIEQAYPGKFRLRSHCRFTGMVDLSSPKNPLLISGNYKRPIRILSNNLRGASHGDTVLVDIYRVTSQYLEAKVLRILKFAQRRMVGTLEVLEQKAYFTPFNQELFCDIEIPLKYIKKARGGDSVVVQFFYYKQKNARRILGKVVKVLGDTDIKQVKNISYLYSKGFSVGFSSEEEAAANAVNFEITEEEIAKRLDMRGITTFTIDPENTKDIDDALSIRMLENGNYEVGVHIADVAHYVKPGSILDRQAYERCVSIYLADNILPMFPDYFTMGCSLFPQQDKLTFSIIFEMNSEAKIVNHKIAKTIIRSQRQFSYDEAQRLIDQPENEIFSQSINTLFAFSEKLYKYRFDNGAITFTNRMELYFEWDDKGNVVNVRPRKRTNSMLLIEEFMLLANRSIAEIAAQKYIPFIYRSHGVPQVKMFRELCRIATDYGYDFKEKKDRQGKSDHAISKNISGFLSQAKTNQEEYLFTYLAIRSMSQGKYSHVPRRHFALAFWHYTHFTSPIRRYVDIAVHRIIAHELIDITEQTGIFDYEIACKHFNQMSRKAKLIKRNSDQQKCTEFLRNKIGAFFESVIIGVTNFQMTVELSESGIQGRILLRSLLDDQYRIDYNTYAIRGRNTKNCYRIGDELRVRLVFVDVERGLIDFAVN